jgi:prephenate dehydrogenase
MDQSPFSRIGIVGLGLIGGSIALGVRERWPGVRLTAVDTPSVVEQALQGGVVDAASDRLEAVTDAELIVLAAPVRQNAALLGQLAGIVPRTAVITDTGSTKRDIVKVSMALPHGVTFVGGHPLGGAAAGGLGHARANLFVERPWIFTPLADSDPSVVSRLVALARAFGATTHVMDAEAHDRLLAFVSHLPQMAASALMDVVGEAVGAEALRLSGRGLADTTRLASSPWRIWQDIAASNADQIGPALDIFIARLQDLRRDLAGGDHLGATFERAARWRAELPDERAARWRAELPDRG